MAPPALLKISIYRIRFVVCGAVPGLRAVSGCINKVLLPAFRESLDIDLKWKD